jgi:uncharacterized membrane protein
MYWILFVMAAIAAVVVAVIVGGLVTPRDHSVARAVVIPASAESVWATIRDFARYDEWRNELEGAEVVDTDQPQPRWRETSTRGSVTFGVTHDEAPLRLVVRILDEDLPFTGEWTWELRTEGAGTRVTITERGSVPNPLFRFIAAHFVGYTRSLDAYLRALAARHQAPNVMIIDATP